MITYGRVQSTNVWSVIPPAESQAYKLIYSSAAVDHAHRLADNRKNSVLFWKIFLIFLGLMIIIPMVLIIMEAGMAIAHPGCKWSVVILLGLLSLAIIISAILYKPKNFNKYKVQKLTIETLIMLFLSYLYPDADPANLDQEKLTIICELLSAYYGCARFPLLHPDDIAVTYEMMVRNNPKLLSNIQKFSGADFHYFFRVLSIVFEEPRFTKAGVHWSTMVDLIKAILFTDSVGPLSHISYNFDGKPFGRLQPLND